MTERELMKVHELSPLLATPQMSEAQAAARFRKFVAERIIQPDDKIGAEGGRPHFLYSRGTQAAAAVLFRLWDFGINDREILKYVFGALTAAPEGEHRVIDLVLADIEAHLNDTKPERDATPALVISQWYRPSDGDTISGGTIHLSGEKEPITCPGPAYLEQAYLVLHLRVALRDFVEKSAKN